MSNPEGYTYRGARALVLLHERELRAFVETWQRAREAGVRFAPEAAGEAAYASLEANLAHVLGAARGYLVWVCEVLGLDDPGIDPPPPAERLGSEVQGYLDHLLARWDLPLRGVDEATLDRSEARSRWGVTYCVDAMLEHAVMHPVRHRFQLIELLESSP